MRKLKYVRVLLIWMLVVSLTACGAVPSSLSHKKETTVEATATPKPDKEERRKPTDTDVSADTAGLSADETTASEKDTAASETGTRLEYTLTDADIEAFEEQLALCREKVLASEAYDVIEAEIEALYEIALGIQDQATIAEILYYCHMNDLEGTANYLDSTEILSDLIVKYNDLLLEIYNGENEEYKKFFEDWTELELKILTGQTTESMSLEVRNAEILTELYSMDESEAEEKIGTLYSEFIKNSNLIAAEYGYSDYYDYATEAVYMRDYGREEREKFREYVKLYIVPIYNVVALQYEKALEELSLREGSMLMKLLFDKKDSLSTDYLTEYFASLPPEAKAGMEHMFEQENYIMTDAEDAYIGAFTASLEEPFCYFGPDSQTLFVIIHELGHYCADYYSEEEVESFDLAETQSQGNEMLFLSHLKTVLPENVYRALFYYEMYDFLNIIIQATLFDEFEEEIYKLADVSDYRTEDYDRIMYDIVSSYSIDDPYDIIPDGMSWLWKNVGIESPVYYLSYAVSATAALNLYSQSTVDYEAAVEAYRKLLEETGEESGFVGALENAGIVSVFEEEAYITLLQILAEE